MIRYDDISPHDLSNYWGRGVILLQFDHWNAYRITNVDDDDVTMELDARLPRHGKKVEVAVRMTQDRFFERAMLHQPQLGVVQRNGVLYHLSWKHPNGMQLCKAMTPENVYVKAMFGEEEQLAVYTNKYEGARWWAVMVRQHRMNMRRIPDEASSALQQKFVRNSLMQIAIAQENMRGRHNNPRLRDRKAHPLGLELVLLYLNQTFASLKEVVSTGKQDFPYVFAPEVWGYKKEGKLHLYLGHNALGSVNTKNRMFTPIDDSDEAEMLGRMIIAEISKEK